MITPNTLLRRALTLDAIASGALALPMALAPTQFSELLELPHGLVLKCGLFLIAYTAFVGWLALRESIPRPALLLVIIGNGLWVIASFALLASSLIAPNMLGTAFIAAQAIAVGIFAELQFVGMRQSARPSHA